MVFMIIYSSVLQSNTQVQPRRAHTRHKELRLIPQIKNKKGHTIGH